jgi:hypothetical protein
MGIDGGRDIHDDLIPVAVPRQAPQKDGSVEDLHRHFYPDLGILRFYAGSDRGQRSFRAVRHGGYRRGFFSS